MRVWTQRTRDAHGLFIIAMPSKLLNTLNAACTLAFHKIMPCAGGGYVDD